MKPSLSQDFLFRRRQIELAIRERARLSDELCASTLKQALEILEKHPDKKFDVIRKVLKHYKQIFSDHIDARVHAEALFIEIDKAAAAYRRGERAAAAQIMGWTTGKRGKVNPVPSIVATYLLQINMGVKPILAVRNIQKIFKQQSMASVIQILKREKKRIPSLPLPGYWPTGKSPEVQHPANIVP